MDINEKITRAEELKNKGNACFKQDDRKEALRHYHEAIMYIHGLNMSSNDFIPMRAKDTSITEDQKIVIDNLMTSIYSNIAACHLKNNNWQQVIKYSSKALEKDEQNFKARIRRVNAQLSIGALDKAADDLVILLDKHSEDADVQRLRIRWRQLTSEADARQRTEFAGMFDRK